MKATKVLAVLGVGLTAACGAPGQDEIHMMDWDPITQEIKTTNGLQAVNGLTANNGLVANNGLATNNGLSTNNGLATNNGLMVNNGLMTSSGGRNTVKYLSKCALSAGDSFSKQDNTGTWHSFPGSLGVGTGWKNGSCGTACQEWITACIMAHVNTTGTSVAFWMTADYDEQPQIGLGEAWQSGLAPTRAWEGTFWGNMFASNPPTGRFLFGYAFNNPIPGRLGAYTTNVPYTQWTGACKMKSNPTHTAHTEAYECGTGAGSARVINTHIW